MSLSCECDYDYAPEFYTSGYRIARKEHKCCECRKVITIGTEYNYSAGKWDGRFETYKTCERCDGLRTSLTDLGYCTPDFGSLKDDYAEYLASIDSHKSVWDIFT